MTALSVNVNKIAVLRNSRGHDLPDPVEAARVAIAAGAQGVTVHPRPDQRHIRSDDVIRIAEELAALDRTAAAGGALAHAVEFNIEGNPFAPPRDGYPGFVELVRRTRPAQATLVPDGDAQLTSDHGFDLARDGERLAPLVQELKSLGCRVSLFVDPDVRDVERHHVVQQLREARHEVRRADRLDQLAQRLERHVAAVGVAVEGVHVEQHAVPR